MIYGYARVSTKNQDLYGNSLQDQEAKLRAAGCETIYHDSFTGTKMDRPQFSVLLQLLQPGDTLTVTKLDRFARTAADGATLIKSLLEKGVTVNILNMGKTDNSPMGKLLTTVLFAFAEFERDMIVERTLAGKAIAKQSPDYKEGRPAKDIPLDTLRKFREKQKGHLMSTEEICSTLGISRATWYAKLKEANI